MVDLMLWFRGEITACGVEAVPEIRNITSDQDVASLLPGRLVWGFAYAYAYVHYIEELFCQPWNWDYLLPRRSDSGRYKRLHMYGWISFIQRMTGFGGSTRRNIDSPDDAHGRLGLECVRDVDIPLVEFVFVHSLPGNPRWTWSWSTDIATYWPQEWLKDDAAFEHVRVHMFGYDTQSHVHLDTAVFSKSGTLLLKELEGNLRLRRAKDVYRSIPLVHEYRLTIVQTPIVFIGHSLGGLVIKKTLIEANQNPKYSELSTRFHSVFFLGTPHRAINMTMVTNIVRACSSDARPPDIESNIIMLEEINQHFDQSFNTVRTFCFYEQQPTFPQSRMVVVNQAAATLDGVEDIGQPCDHPGLAKFENIADHPYQHLRNALSDVVEEIVDERVDPGKAHRQLEDLQPALNTSGDEETELDKLEGVEGTCRWLIADEDFERWRDAPLIATNRNHDTNRRLASLALYSHHRPPPATVVQMFWLTGRPGCGKTYLSAFVIRHLQELKRPCSYYFLKHTDRSRQNLGRLLRSLAYQMACADPVFRRLLVAMKEEGSLTAEYNSIQPFWNQVFVARLFRAKCLQRQYWVIDSLDEGIGGQELITLISRIPKDFPLSIFVTTRGDFQMARLSRSLSMHTKSISADDTAADIRIMLQDENEYLNVDDSEKSELIAQLVKKSGGSFLWVCQVLDRLTRVYSKEDIAKVLDEIPEDMTLLYTQILQEMQERRYANLKLTQAILSWTTCASRPLTTDELQGAILRDTGHEVPKMERMIQDFCGQLIVVDKAKKVQLVHETAREFLLNPKLSSVFAIRKSNAHGRLAEVCLRYLLEVEGRPLHQRGVHGSRFGKSSSIDEYAHLFFSEHVVRDSRPDSDIASLLEEFFDTAVLYWVEYVSRRKDLAILTQTAKNLKAWIEIRSNYQGPTTTGKLISMWATDLIRLVTVFGECLVREPGCIHTVIAPLSPKTSAIYTRYGSSPVGMEVAGLSSKGWAERIFSAPFPDDDATSAVSASESHYAVGLRSGSVILYTSSTCQEAGRLIHNEPITHMKFSGANEWLAVCGTNTLTLWNFRTAEKQWQCYVPNDPVALGFFELDSIIIILSRDGNIIEFATANGKVLQQHSWYVDQETGRNQPPPKRAYLSNELNMAALIYKGHPLLLIDLGNVSRPRSVDARSTISAFTFNDHLKMIALSFMDGETSIYQLSTLRKERSTTAQASELMASADGKSLLVCNNDGYIQIHEFENLSLLSVLALHDEAVRCIAFSPNSLRFVDIRRREFNVWEPGALVRRKDTDRSSRTSQGHTTFSSAASNPVDTDTTTSSSPVSSMAIHDSADFAFCGKDDGSVCVYELNKGRFQKTLYKCGNVPISFLDWNSPKQILVSSDSRRVTAHQVQIISQRPARRDALQWSVKKLWEHEIDSPIRQILSSTDGEHLMISNGVADHLLTLNREEIFLHRCEHPEIVQIASQKWAVHLHHQHRMFEIGTKGLHCLNWSDREHVVVNLQEMSVRDDDNDDDRIVYEAQDRKVSFVGFGENSWAAFDNDPVTRPILWTLQPGQDSQPSQLEFHHYYHRMAPEIHSLIGLYGPQLVFMNSTGWVCSIRVDEVAQTSSVWHFPVPYYWQSTNQRTVRTVTKAGNVIFAKGDELAIVKRGLNK